MQKNLWIILWKLLSANANFITGNITRTSYNFWQDWLYLPPSPANNPTKSLNSCNHYAALKIGLLKPQNFGFMTSKKVHRWLTLLYVEEFGHWIYFSAPKKIFCHNCLHILSQFHVIFIISALIKWIYK